MNSASQRTSTASSGISGDIDITLTGGRVTLWHTLDDETVYLDKEEAIDIAERILLFYGVAFCNRVAGSGVADGR